MNTPNPDSVDESLFQALGQSSQGSDREGNPDQPHFRVNLAASAQTGPGRSDYLSLAPRIVWHPSTQDLVRVPRRLQKEPGPRLGRQRVRPPEFAWLPHDPKCSQMVECYSIGAL